MRFRITTGPAAKAPGRFRGKVELLDPEAPDSKAFVASGCGYIAVDGSTVANSEAMARLLLKASVLDELSQWAEEAYQELSQTGKELPCPLTSVEFEEVSA